jgi:hypothetical protein
MKYAGEMGSGAMIYIPNFIKIGSGFQTLIGGIHQGKYSNNFRTYVEQSVRSKLNFAFSCAGL